MHKNVKKKNENSPNQVMWVSKGKAHIDYYHIRTHVPGFQSFGMGQISHQHKG